MRKVLSLEDIKCQATAVKFIKDNKKLLIEKFASPQVFTSREEPITIFMAGVPGAGKTEISKNIIKEKEIKPVRIDADDIRKLFKDIGYNGTNSDIFQQACSHGVDKLFDYVQYKKLHAIVDGTFASNNSIKNVERVIGRGRKVFIYFIYQDPEIAWKITKGREIKEGRSVPEEAFINAYTSSIKNVNEAKAIFKNEIELNIIIKNAQDNLEKQHLNKDKVDSFIEKVYSKNEIRDIIKKL